MDARPIRHKKIAFLTRRPDLTETQFSRHWKDVHGPTVASAPGYTTWRDRYVQNHVVGHAFGRPFSYDGMAEFWLPGRQSGTGCLDERGLVAPLRP